MRHILFTLSTLLTSLTLQSQEIGFFGKKNNFEVNFGAKPDFNKKQLFENTKLTASLNYGAVYRRQFKSNQAFGASFSSTKLTFNGTNQFYVPTTSSYYNVYTNGLIAAEMGINRGALFIEFGKKSSTLPIGLSNEVGVGVYSATLKALSYTPEFYNGTSNYSKSQYGISDFSAKEITRIGAYFHWRLNLKIAVSEKFLINLSYLSNIAFPINNELPIETGKVQFYSDRSFTNRAAYMDIGTFKIGGVFVF